MGIPILITAGLRDRKPAVIILTAGSNDPAVSEFYFTTNGCEKRNHVRKQDSFFHNR